MGILSTFPDFGVPDGSTCTLSKLDPKLNPEPMLLQPTGVPQEVQVQESCDYPRAACLSRLLWGGRGVPGGEVPALE